MSPCDSRALRFAKFALWGLLSFGWTVQAVVLPNPTITASATSSSSGNAVSNLFDNNDTDYRTPSGTGNATYVEFDFGAPATVDGFVNVTRNSTSSVVTGSRLIFDTDGTTGFDAATDTVVSFTAANTGSLGQGYVNRFAPVTARKVRWEVTSSSGGSLACGAMEMRFLNTTPGAAPITGVAVAGGSTQLDGYHALANATNGIAGRTPSGVTITPSVGYKSAGQGTSTYVDFDLGQIRQVSGFDFFDNLATDQRVNGFTLTFANDASFASPVAVRTYTGNTGFLLSDTFAPVVARYARYQVTACAGLNPGLSEIVFYDSSAAGLPGGFSTVGNPANGWLHGYKASPLASPIEAFDTYAAAQSGAPCNRWDDGVDGNAFVGIAPSNSTTTGWGAVATNWVGGSVYHAWRARQSFPIVSRFIISKTGAYNLSATWKSHTVPGCSATTWIVVNGSTVASGSINGFAGTSHGTSSPSGTAPSATCEAFGLQLAAGTVVDLVTVPVSDAGNTALTASFAETSVPTESTATVVIREFCASNATGLIDEDGDHSDWIEIYNGTGASVDLTGWALTDKSAQPLQWVFPPRVLPHGRRLMVFASGKDPEKRPNYGPGSELHTGFALSKNGEFLGLADSSGQFVSSFAPQFPIQYDDLTYGAGSNGVTGYMQPSAGAINGSATSSPPAFLSFSVPSGLISGTQNVSITGQSAGHTVRYTTNGTEPTLSNGSTYSGSPVSITASTTLRARAFADGVGGPLAIATYSLIGSTAQYGITPSTFTSSLPILVIDGPAEPASDKSPLVSRFTLIDRRESDGTTRLADPPAIATRGTINLRGQTSSGFPKKPYAIEFWDAADRDQALEVLGMPKESDWVLYASYQFDTDFMRNVLMFELCRGMGRWAPRTRFVEVFFNTGTGSPVDAADYRGVYVLMEKIKVDGNRVDIADLSPFDNAGDALTGGYIIARDKWGNQESSHPELLTGVRNSFPGWPYSAGGDFVVKSPSVTEITAAQRNYITNYTMECDTAVTRSDRRHPVTGLHIFDYIGRDSFIDHHMLNAFAKNPDGIRISTYLEKDRLGKLRMSSIWDFDRTQDADIETRDNNPNSWNSDNATDSSDFFSVDGRQAEGWFHYLHQIPAYLQDWVDHYDRWRTAGVLDVTAINSFLDQRAAELAAPDNNGTAAADTPIARNFARWSRNTRGVSTNGSNAADIIFGTAATSEINRHKTWISQRLAFMDSWVLRKPVASLAGGVVAPGTPLDLTSQDLAGDARIYYTTDGTDPFAEDGSIAPGAVEWTGPLALNTSTRLIARLRNPTAASKHTAWSAPLETNFIISAVRATAANLTVSELMYHPADPTPAEIAAGFTSAEDFEFIELRNVGASRINLWGARFTEGIEFTFPNGLDPALAELAPGDTILLASNAAAFAFRYGNAAASRLAGVFSDGTNLSNSGETLVMLDAAGNVILDFAYGYDASWPVAADGGAASLHYIAGDPDAASSWFAHTPDPAISLADADGDGQSDLAEWLAGVDPGDVASRFEIANSGITPLGGFAMMFRVKAGHTYRIERSADLVIWVPAAADFVASQSGPHEFADVVSSSSPQFYRVLAIARP